MGIARSTSYDKAASTLDDTALVEATAAICDDFEAYGWRRIQAALRQQDVNGNHKKIKRLMREHDLQPRLRRRFVRTTDSDHDQPVFANLAKEMIVDGPNQLWVADITCVAVAVGFAHIAAILDAWSRRVVGYAISRSIDARLTIAALKAAVALRRPPQGCVHHADRGSQYAASAYRELLGSRKLAGSMGRRGNLHDNAKAESFMKTLKLKGGYPMDFGSFEDVAEHLPRFIDEIYTERRLHSALGNLSPVQFEQE